MDPLSITTSILTILGVGSTINSGFRRILTLKDAPAALMALNNEVNDLHRVTRAIDDLLRRDPNKSNDISTLHFVEKLETAEGIALDVQKFISYGITVVAADGQNTRVDRSRWLRSGTRLQELKVKIQSCKADLTLELGMFNSSLAINCNITSYAVLQRFENFEQGVKHSFQSIMDTQERGRGNTMLTNLDHRHRKRLLPASAVSHEYQDPEDDVENESDYNTELVTDNISPYLLDTSSQIRNTPAPTTTEHFLISTVTSRSCSTDCSCTCHKSRRIRTPQYLDRVIGSLFVGYRLSPLFTSPCSDIDCQFNTTQVNYTYAFPKWFLNRVLNLSIRFDRSRGPELNLRVMNLRPDNAPGFMSIAWDKSEIALVTVKSLLNTKQASVLDVDSYGDSLLGYAIEYHHLSLVELLLKEGADVVYTNKYGISPIFQAWSDILNASSNSKGFVELSALFPADDYEQLEFSPLHRAVLHLSGLSVEAALEMTDRSQIDSIDSQGKTSLMWAACRGELGVMSRLLACGADPNKQDVSKRTALHWAALKGHADCIEKLIVAKASLEITDFEDRTPLMRTLYSDHPCLALTVLLKHGAKVDHQDNIGWSVLTIAATQHCKSDTVPLLVEYGADINAHDLFGASALLYAVSCNNHDALQTILTFENLQLGHEGKNRGILAIAAWSSDTKTLQILISAIDRFDIDCDDKEWMVQCATERAEERLAIHEAGETFLYPRSRFDGDPTEWFELFQELCSKFLDPRRIAATLGQLLRTVPTLSTVRNHRLRTTIGRTRQN